MGSSTRHDQLWLVKSGNNLEVSLIGTTDKAIIKDWYLGTARRADLDRWQGADGHEGAGFGGRDSRVLATACGADDPERALPSSPQPCHCGQLDLIPYFKNLQ